MSYTDEFIKSVVPGAQGCEYETGVRTSVTTSQAILESGWGQYVPRDKQTGLFSFNLFGIKGSGPAGSVLIDTWEFYTEENPGPNGEIGWHLIEDYFRAYNSYAESIIDHGRLLLKPLYHKVIAAKTPYEQARELKAAGYATGPTYDQSLITLINQFDLGRFDLTEEDHQMIEELKTELKTLRDDYDNTRGWVERLANEIGTLKNNAGHSAVIPDWAKEAINKAVVLGVLRNPEDFSLDMPRLMVFFDNLGLFPLKQKAD